LIDFSIIFSDGLYIGYSEYIQKGVYERGMIANLSMISYGIYFVVYIVVRYMGVRSLNRVRYYREHYISDVRLRSFFLWGVSLVFLLMNMESGPTLYSVGYAHIKDNTPSYSSVFSFAFMLMMVFGVYRYYIKSFFRREFELFLLFVFVFLSLYGRRSEIVGVIALMIVLSSIRMRYFSGKNYNIFLVLLSGVGVLLLFMVGVLRGGMGFSGKSIGNTSFYVFDEGITYVDHLSQIAVSLSNIVYMINNGYSDFAGVGMHNWLKAIVPSFFRSNIGIGEIVLENDIFSIYGIASSGGMYVLSILYLYSGGSLLQYSVYFLVGSVLVLYWAGRFDYGLLRYYSTGGVVCLRSEINIMAFLFFIMSYPKLVFYHPFILIKGVVAVVIIFSMVGFLRRKKVC